MKSLHRLFCVSLVFVSACGSDDTGPTADASHAPDSAQTVDAPPTIDATVIDADMGASPVIASVSWSHALPCQQGVRSDVLVTTSATDADTAANLLAYAGSVSGCTGTLNSASATLGCPQAAPYSGSITVSDPEAHSDTMNFLIAPCTDGQAP